jgi:uncharacterized membrane protein
MFIIWGKTSKKKHLGIVADSCQLCGRPER